MDGGVETDAGVCPQGSAGPGCGVCVVYVNQSGGSNANDGKTWGTAKADLQTGIDTAFAASPPCQVWVAKGTYAPTYLPPSSSGVNGTTLELKTGVAMYGGFAGGELSLARNPAANPTIITGESGNPNDVTDNLVVVVTAADQVTFDGFTVTSAYGNAVLVGSKQSFTIANCSFSGNNAGSIVSSQGALTVVNSTFTGNSSGAIPQDGGAISAIGGLTVSGSTFTNNRASGNGGAIYGATSMQISNSVFKNNQTFDSTDTNPGLNGSEDGGAIYLVGPQFTTVIDGCTFTSNKTPSQFADQKGNGGAIGVAGQTLIVKNSTFTSNGAITSGGAIGSAVSPSALVPTSVLIQDCTFTKNTAHNGGAVYASAKTFGMKRSVLTSNAGVVGGGLNCYGPCNVVNTQFASNTATMGGGAINFEFQPNLAAITGCLFSGNSTPETGGAIQSLSRTFSLANCTFYGNKAAGGGAVYEATGSMGTITNSIFAGDSGTGGMDSDEVYVEAASGGLAIRATDIDTADNNAIHGNLDVDPDFVSLTSAALDLHLQPTSACVDVGNNADLPADVLDVDEDGNTTEPLPLDLGGAPRIYDAVVDLGAYEFNP